MFGAGTQAKLSVLSLWHGHSGYLIIGVTCALKCTLDLQHIQVGSDWPIPTLATENSVALVAPCMKWHEAELQR